MSNFPVHTIDTAPEASKPILDSVAKAWNMVPNLHAVLAESPTALQAYTTLFGIFEGSTLGPIERQVVYLVNNFENECRYCMAGHSVLARMAGADPATIAALRDGRPLDDARLEALRLFTTAVVRQRGVVAPDAVDAFLAAGFTRPNLLEVIVGTAVKTISNYTNHIAETPLDPFMKDTVWTPPSRSAA